MLDIISKYNNKEIKLGSIDCNLVFLEIFEKEFYNKIVYKYDDERSGAKIAKKETGYSSIYSLITKNEIYKETNKNLINKGSFFINKKDKLHVSICIGDKVLASLNGRFKLFPVSIFLNDDKYVMYQKGDK